MIRIEKTFLKSYVKDEDLKKLQPKIDQVVGQLQKGTCPGNEFLGWLNLPDRIDTAELKEIKAVASYIRDRAEQFVSVGIGGSYLGARAAIKFL
ncbi:glucose-6-phosphate isomerase, partial [candidate division KSB1 bacterium]|nr:glucose-6-phosphate isomerase [candidate division KSB1 bacterium]